MHRTTVNVPEALFQQARIKALREDVAVGEVIRDLLARWVSGELELGPRDGSRERLVALAWSARGMWSDREPDALAAAGRAGLAQRDRELENARLDV